MVPLFVSVPHAGEIIPDETPWLRSLPEPVLMCDTDRFVDRLYGPAAQSLGIETVVAEIHRYVVDLNRVPSDVDADSVLGSDQPAGRFTTGYHWSKTTTGQVLMRSPISQELHRLLTEKYFRPFHAKVESCFSQRRSSGAQKVYHLDAHSMPSKGTAAHRDPGGQRAQIVVSDRDGVSSEPFFKDLVIEAYTQAGFEVAYNWPYKGGRITETYGQPQKGQHTIQVEMNRSLYMNEENKQPLGDQFSKVQGQVLKALAFIFEGLKK
jgi:N-formylglutamate deformylase